MPRPPSASPLRRALATTALVGTGVSLGHAVAPDASWWPAVHVLLPAAVFSSAAWGAGHRAWSWRLAVRGVATVMVVALSFGVINSGFDLVPWARVALNFLVPLGVSIAGGKPLASSG